jgi:hypothetical protein
MEEKIVEEILKKIATGIETTCGIDICPCREGCHVYSDEECMDRIVSWLRLMMETKPFEEE